MTFISSLLTACQASNLGLQMPYDLLQFKPSAPEPSYQKHLGLKCPRPPTLPKETLACSKIVTCTASARGLDNVPAAAQTSFPLLEVTGIGANRRTNRSIERFNLFSRLPSCSTNRSLSRNHASGFTNDGLVQACNNARFPETTPA